MSQALNDDGSLPYARDARGKPVLLQEVEDWAAAGGGATPTLAEVLVAGTLVSSDSTGQVRIHAPDDDGNGPDLTIQWSTGGAGEWKVAGGSVVDPAGQGGKVRLQGGYADNDGDGVAGGDLVILGGGAAGAGIGGDLVFTPGAGDGIARNGLVFLNLPTSDPGVSGALWNNAGTVKVSA